MAQIASGWRQIHRDADDNMYVLFDDGIYAIDPSAAIDSSEGEDWIFCESHADDDKDVAHAQIGGVMMPLAGPAAEGRDFDEVVDADGDGTEDASEDE